MLTCSQQIILYVLIAIIATMIVSYILVYYYASNLPAIVVDQLSKKFTKPCEIKFPMVYREAVYLPKVNGRYEQKLAIALTDVSYMTSDANCPTVLPIPLPPGFDQYLRVEGIEPVSGDRVMLAYIFWERQLCHAIISFTGTEARSLWRANARYQQVPPVALNGYQDGMLMHSGFYDVYMAVRDQLWAWWNENSSWVATLYLTGHSLGGALSSICAFDFAQVFMNCNPISVTEKQEITYPLPIHYSYGSPKVANNLFAEVFSQRVPTSLRVCNTEDIVIGLPLSAMFDYIYCSLGQDLPFTVSLGSTSANHNDAYYYNLPVCAEVGGCTVEEIEE